MNLIVDKPIHYGISDRVYKKVDEILTAISLHKEIKDNKFEFLIENDGDLIVSMIREFGIKAYYLNNKIIGEI